MVEDAVVAYLQMMPNRQPQPVILSVSKYSYPSWGSISYISAAFVPVTVDDVGMQTRFHSRIQHRVYQSGVVVVFCRGGWKKEEEESIISW